ncbi:glycosyltransferase family 4 protein [Thalassobellus citreus]|uniref:glycosyltransferase family 4 protein n=1 Tax=Thalassobellus citreus TaxID=3367752 RepID=UPI0037B91222
MKKVLWLAPNINHYKVRFLNHLAKVEGISLTLLSGTGRQGMGDQEIGGQYYFKHIQLPVNKQNFGKNGKVRKQLKKCFNNYNWVLIPAEKKNIPLLLYAMRLRKQNNCVRLFSYNHHLIKPKRRKIHRIDVLLTKIFFKQLDRVIFYTQESYNWAITNRIIEKNKAGWANNTIDTIEVDKNYNFELPPIDTITIVFIGRLIPSKRIGVLIDFFNEISEKRNNKFMLEIIGDGPDSFLVKKAMKHNPKIIWHRTIVEEIRIAPIMTRASLVFIPGASGLSINHAFAYGRPYATLKSNRHGPEISYLIDGENGYIIDNDLNKIKTFLKDRKKVEEFCFNALKKSKGLSVLDWTKQIITALND